MAGMEGTPQWKIHKNKKIAWVTTSNWKTVGSVICKDIDEAFCSSWELYSGTELRE